VIETGEGQALADELGTAFAECSALEGDDVERPIFDLARCVRERRVNTARATEVETTMQEGERKRSIKGVLDQLEDLSHKAWVFG
jgi:hypothetical protein